MNALSSQLQYFGCFFCSWQLRKNTENGAAVTLLWRFVPSDDFNRQFKYYVSKEVSVWGWPHADFC